MRLLLFMLGRSIKPAVLITVFVSVVSCVMLTFCEKGGYVYDKEYDSVFSSLEADTAYDKVSEMADNTRAQNDDLAKRAGDYIAAHTKPGSPPPVLPDGLAGQAVRAAQKGDDSSSAGQGELYEFMGSSLKDGKESEQHIGDKLSGYKRNARRGVTDEYSLALSAVLTRDYEQVLDNQQLADKLYDTRAANAYLEYIENDMLFFVLVFLLCFSSFSSERQSRRLSAFAITKAGAARFIFCRIISAGLVCGVCAVIYCLLQFCGMCLSGGVGCLDMPLQYLKGYALSSYAISFGGLCIAAVVLRVLLAEVLCVAMLLLSFLSKRNITAGLICLAPTAVMIGLSKSDNSTAQFVTCKFSFLFGGEGYVRVFSTPYPVVWLYVLICAFAAGALFITLIAQGQRREY